MWNCGSIDKETDPKWHLHIFTTPDLHLVIICSNVFKVLLWDWEKTPGKSRCSEIFQDRYKSYKCLKDSGCSEVKATQSLLLYRVGFILAQPFRILRDRFPAESQAPVKVTSVESAVGGNRLVELKGVEVNGADLWTNHSSGFFNNAGQQGLQPTMETLTYRGEEEHFRLPPTISIRWRELLFVIAWLHENTGIKFSRYFCPKWQLFSTFLNPYCQGWG